MKETHAYLIKKIGISAESVYNKLFDHSFALSKNKTVGENDFR